MKTIKQSCVIYSSPEEVWKGLTDSKYIENWGGGPSKMNSEVDKEFSLWGGSIWGKNIEVEKEHKLVQEWWSEKKWKSPSLVTFTLSKTKEGTEVKLLHENVPDGEAGNIEEGWQEYYLGPMKDYLEV